MDPTLYKFLHLAGAMCLFLGLGGLLLPSDVSPSTRKLGSMLHGIGLLFVLVAGFGMIAKLKLGFPGWIIAKIGLWIVFAVLPVLGKKGIVPAKAAWIIALACGAGAAYLGVLKPF